MAAKLSQVAVMPSMTVCCPVPTGTTVLPVFVVARPLQERGVLQGRIYRDAMDRR